MKQARGKLLHLNMVLANRVAHEHGVEGGHFVNSHAGHSDHLKGSFSDFGVAIVVTSATWCMAVMGSQPPTCL